MEHSFWWNPIRWRTRRGAVSWNVNDRNDELEKWAESAKLYLLFILLSASVVVSSRDVIYVVCSQICTCAKFVFILLITDLYYFIQIPYRPTCVFESYVRHVAADKLVNTPTKMAASSVERCWWTVCGRKYLSNKSTASIPEIFGQADPFGAKTSIFNRYSLEALQP